MNNSEVIDRMKTLSGLREDQDLAKAFELQKSTIANWRRGTNIPLGKLIWFAETYDTSLDWLILGKERKPALDEMAQMLLDNYKRLDPVQKLQLLNASQGKTAVGVVQNVGDNNRVSNLAGGNIKMTK